MLYAAAPVRPCSPRSVLECGTLACPAGLDASALWQKASLSTRGGPFARLCQPGRCLDLRSLVSTGIRRRVEIFAELGNRPRTDVRSMRRRLHILRTDGPCRMSGADGIVAAGRPATDYADYGGLPSVVALMRVPSRPLHLLLCAVQRMPSRRWGTASRRVRPLQCLVNACVTA